jgi:hypothetical protein
VVVRPALLTCCSVLVSLMRTRCGGEVCCTTTACPILFQPCCRCASEKGHYLPLDPTVPSDSATLQKAADFALLPRPRLCNAGPSTRGCQQWAGMHRCLRGPCWKLLQPPTPPCARTPLSSWSYLYVVVHASLAGRSLLWYRLLHFLFRNRYCWLSVRMNSTPRPGQMRRPLKRHRVVFNTIAA